MKRRRWIIISLTLIVIILIGISTGGRKKALQDVAAELLDTTEIEEVTYVEELMVTTRTPEMIPLEDKEDSKAILEAMEDTQVKFLRTELGMEITTDLYTITIRSNDHATTLTFDANGYVHSNDDDKTYQIVNDVNIYSIVQKVYKENCN